MQHLDSLDWEKRQIELAQGFLTGNIFDWGASEAIRFFTQEQDTVDGMTSFEKARAKLQVSVFEDSTLLVSMSFLIKVILILLIIRSRMLSILSSKQSRSHRA